MKMRKNKTKPAMQLQCNGQLGCPDGGLHKFCIMCENIMKLNIPSPLQIVKFTIIPLATSPHFQELYIQSHHHDIFKTINMLIAIWKKSPLTQQVANNSNF